MRLPRLPIDIRSRFVPEIDRTRNRVHMSSVVAAMSVTAPWLTSAVYIRELKEAMGRTFFKLTKSNDRVARLLVGKSSTDVRGLTPTTIVEAVADARSAKQAQIMAACSSDPAEQESLGIDEPARKKAKVDFNMLLECAEVTIDIDPVGSHRMFVLLGDGPVWVEMTVATIDFLHDVAARQLQSAKTVPMDKGEAIDVAKGVVWVKARRAYRARYWCDETKKLKTKDFRAKGESDEHMDLALDAAKSFIVNTST